MDLALVIALWLHTVAFVIAWGYYGVLGRMVLPGLERTLERTTQADALLAIERRALPLILVSLVLFIVTGSYLLVVDPKYAGLGDFFASTWTTLMLVKHLVIVALVVAAVVVDVSIRHAAEAADEGVREGAFRRVRLSAEVATVLGALVVLLTAAAQAAPQLRAFLTAAGVRALAPCRRGLRR
jgi:uncharacterized membrane protein